jgi:hypothetical protein
MLQFQSLPPFRLRYGGSASKSLITELGRWHHLPLDVGRITLCMMLTKRWAGILRIAAAERRVLEYPVNANRQGGRMKRYVPKGIVGALSGIKNCR